MQIIVLSAIFLFIQSLVIIITNLIIMNKICKLKHLYFCIFKNISFNSESKTELCIYRKPYLVV